MPFSITILGSSGALPAYGRFPSSQYVNIQNHHFLIDCGEGTQMQMMRYQVNLSRINHIFISHLHGDHYLGLMGLIFSMHLRKRTADLHLYSHRGLDEIITAQLRYSGSVPNFRIHFHMLEKDVQRVIFEDDVLTVETIPLSHKIRCSGFLFKEKPKPRRIDKDKLPEGLLHEQIIGLKMGSDITDEAGKVLFRNQELTLPPRLSRSYAYCSDTAYDEKIIEQIQKVDVLYHESTFITEDESKALETYHSTAWQAGMIAQKASVGKLLLGHFSARYKELEPVLEEARKEFARAELGREGETFSIADH